MKKRITKAMLLIAMAVIAIPGAWSNTAVRAQDEESATALARPRDVALFGLVGLARGQTARLNVVNLRSAPAVTPTADQIATPIPCAVRLRFLDQRGNTIARSFESVLPGNGAFLDLPFSDAAPPGFMGKRVEVRAVVQVIREPAGTRCAAISTVEIFDNETGRTTAFYGESPR